jgi:hypothetical protein
VRGRPIPSLKLASDTTALWDFGVDTNGHSATLRVFHGACEVRRGAALWLGLSRCVQGRVCLAHPKRRLCRRAPKIAPFFLVCTLRSEAGEHSALCRARLPGHLRRVWPAPVIFRACTSIGSMGSDGSRRWTQTATRGARPAPQTSPRRCTTQTDGRESSRQARRWTPDARPDRGRPKYGFPLRSARSGGIRTRPGGRYRASSSAVPGPSSGDAILN